MTDTTGELGAAEVAELSARILREVERAIVGKEEVPPRAPAARSWLEGRARPLPLLERPDPAQRVPCGQLGQAVHQLRGGLPAGHEPGHHGRAREELDLP